MRDEPATTEKLNQLSATALAALQTQLRAFWKQRKDDPALRLMLLEDWHQQHGVANQRVQVLTIRGSRPPYLGRKLRMRIEFPKDYPANPPKVYSLPVSGQTLLHPNVYDDNGQVCHPMLQRQDYLQLQPTLVDILKAIQVLLYNPNFRNAANLVLSATFTKDESAYYQAVSQNARLLESCDSDSDSDSSPAF